MNTSAPGISPDTIFQFTLGSVNKEIETRVRIGIDRQVLSVSWLASQFNMSERQLLRIIKKRHHVTTKEFINNIKLDLAKQILSSNSRISVKSLSSKLMFSDNKYFSKLFKSKFGCNPSEFRRFSETSNRVVNFEKIVFQVEENNTKNIKWSKVSDNTPFLV